MNLVRRLGLSVSSILLIALAASGCTAPEPTADLTPNQVVENFLELHNQELCDEVREYLYDPSTSRCEGGFTGVGVFTEIVLEEENPELQMLGFEQATLVLGETVIRGNNEEPTESEYTGLAPDPTPISVLLVREEADDAWLIKEFTFRPR